MKGFEFLTKKEHFSETEERSGKYYYYFRLYDENDNFLEGGIISFKADLSEKKPTTMYMKKGGNPTFNPDFFPNWLIYLKAEAEEKFDQLTRVRNLFNQEK